MHASIVSHLLCRALAVASVGIIAVRVVRDYREYHPRPQSDESAPAPQPLIGLQSTEEPDLYPAAAR